MAGALQGPTGLWHVLGACESWWGAGAVLTSWVCPCTSVGRRARQTRGNCGEGWGGQGGAAGWARGVVWRRRGLTRLGSEDAYEFLLQAELRQVAEGVACWHHAW